MTKEKRPDEHAVYTFILDRIDSVPHLEALLLLWNTRPKSWSPTDLASRLYLSPDTARRLLQDLHVEELIAVAPEAVEQYFYKTRSDDFDELIDALDKTYRKQLVRVSTTIHSKASSAVRDFARAFRLKKDRT